ncbi:MAG: DUF6247 family protein [Pseudonocardiaceae bacterium]
MAAIATAQFAGFADKQPAFLRSVILPEDRAVFDEQYRAALTTAGEALDLSDMEAFLERWRRTAWLQHDMGHDRYRAMLEQARDTLRTGNPPPGTRVHSAEHMRELFRARQTQA